LAAAAWPRSPFRESLDPDPIGNVIATLLRNRFVTFRIIRSRPIDTIPPNSPAGSSQENVWRTWTA
jgi:hypothetical protein